MSTEENVEKATELVFFTGYTPNDAQDNALKTVRILDGCLRTYSGAQIEESTNGIWVQDWASLAHHKAFMSSPEYGPFVAGVPNFAKTVAKILHVCLTPYPAITAFEAPATEVLVATLKDASAETREAFEAIVAMMHGGVKVTPGAIASAHGITLENYRTYVYVCGWESIEAHKQALAPDYAQEVLKKLYDLADVDVTHYNLKDASAIP